LSRKPILLDLFCCAGGAGMGYHRAGFDVVGVDKKPQRNYPFRFVQADALEYLAECGRCFDAIHASPPCQEFSCTHSIHAENEYPDLIEPTRELLVSSGKPWIMENVIGAPLVDTVTLCGLMFGLKVFRHRLFESNVFLMQPPHHSHKGKRIGKDGYCTPSGHGDNSTGLVPPDHRRKAAWASAMGIDWMTKEELTQAIPPAYTEFLGRQLLLHL